MIKLTVAPAWKLRNVVLSMRSATGDQPGILYLSNNNLAYERAKVKKYMNILTSGNQEFLLWECPGLT